MTVCSSFFGRSRLVGSFRDKGVSLNVLNRLTGLSVLNGLSGLKSLTGLNGLKGLPRLTVIVHNFWETEFLKQKCLRKKNEDKKF